MTTSSSHRWRRLPAGSVPAAELPAGWYDVYCWIRHLTRSAELAEELTVDVCRRLTSGHPPWLASTCVDVQNRFFVAQVVLEHRKNSSPGVRTAAMPHVPGIQAFPAAGGAEAS